MEIKKILIANRGEVAVRIIKTCKDMGIKTVAVCPKLGDENDFLETKLADEFYYLDREGILGYLDQRKIIEIAKRAKADAVHPGYGFLAENGDFADLCVHNEIKFIGPKGDILRKVGDKIGAKKIAYQVGLPLLRGPQRAINEKECFKLAKKIGPPFLLKAKNGGGGIGIDEIHRINKDEIRETFRKLERLTESAFGSPNIFIEKLLMKPRHIEFQILGDGQGKVVHFGERECSIQRRHQKLIEEAPSPFLDKKLREKMGKLVVRLGESMRYESLGTVEFLMDENRNFYFIEVNPRLQVEHPVTEQIFGIDLVEHQIRIAQGERLHIKQKHIRHSGWAMEFRICAEEAQNDFKPISGKIREYILPTGKGIEIHTFLQLGQNVPPYFDSLVLKLVIFAKDRWSCIQRAKRAFDEFRIEGVPTLIPFFRVLINNRNFIEGKLSTSFINDERILEELKRTKIMEEEIKEAEKVTLDIKKIDNKEVAKLVANLFQKLIKKQEPESKINNWKLTERMQIFE